jgi:sec-independent protein translocase protein TatB
MLDFSFTEMMLIAVVALVVLGPERLPKVAKTIGHLVGRMQRYVADVKSDITREMELDELRRFRQTVEETASTVQSSFSAFESGARADVRELEAIARVDGHAMPPAQMPASAGAHSLAEDASGPAPLPEVLPEALPFESATGSADEWVEPTVAGAMSSLASSARYMPTASLAMCSLAEPLAGGRHRADGTPAVREA